MRFDEKIVVKGKLKTLTPLHIGSSENTFLTDMPVIVNGEGIPYIPGTSLAGVFRAYLIERCGVIPVIKYFFGTQDRDKKGIKSHIIVNDAVAEKLSLIHI